MNLILIISIVLHLVDGHNVHKHYKADRPTTLSQFEDHEHGKFDHDALFGASRDELNQLAPEDAKRRLRKFIADGRLDEDQNGFVSKGELSRWVVNSFQSISKQDALDQLKEEDENQDGSISWSEHYKNNFNLGAEQTLDEKEMIYEDRELFNAADLNHDGLLDSSEFPLFTSPEDFPPMFDTLYRLTMRRRDINGDGVLSFDEYIVNEKGVMPDRTSEGYLIDKEKFENDLDRNKDGLLSKEETISWIVPNATEIANEEAEHLIDACDDNKDGQLSIDEIVNNYDVFMESEVTEYGDKLKEMHHDEL